MTSRFFDVRTSYSSSPLSSATSRVRFSDWHTCTTVLAYRNRSSSPNTRWMASCEPAPFATHLLALIALERGTFHQCCIESSLVRSLKDCHESQEEAHKEERTAESESAELWNQFLQNKDVPGSEKQSADSLTMICFAVIRLDGLISSMRRIRSYAMRETEKPNPSIFRDIIWKFQQIDTEMVDAFDHIDSSSELTKPEQTRFLPRKWNSPWREDKTCSRSTKYRRRTWLIRDVWSGGEPTRSGYFRSQV